MILGLGYVLPTDKRTDDSFQKTIKYGMTWRENMRNNATYNVSIKH